MPDIDHPNIGNVSKTKYRKGTIVSIGSDDTATVSIPGAGNIADVPIFYHCSDDVVEASNGSLPGSSAAFAADDEVIVQEFVQETGNTYKIIGHADGDKRICGVWQFRLEGNLVSSGPPVYAFLTPANVKTFDITLSTFTRLTNIRIVVTNGDFDNPVVTITPFVSDFQTFAPAIFKSISFNSVGNFWEVRMTPSPDESIATPVSNICIQSKVFQENYTALIQATVISTLVINEWSFVRVEFPLSSGNFIGSLAFVSSVHGSTDVNGNSLPLDTVSAVPCDGVPTGIPNPATVAKPGVYYATADTLSL